MHVLEKGEAETSNSCSKVYFDGGEHHRARRTAVLMHETSVKWTKYRERENVQNDAENRFDEILSHSCIRYAQLRKEDTSLLKGTILSGCRRRGCLYLWLQGTNVCVKDDAHFNAVSVA